MYESTKMRRYHSTKVRMNIAVPSPYYIYKSPGYYKQYPGDHPVLSSHFIFSFYLLILYLIIIPFTIPGIIYRYAHSLLVMIEAAGDGRNLITLQLYARHQYIGVWLIAAFSAH